MSTMTRREAGALGGQAGAGVRRPNRGVRINTGKLTEAREALGMSRQALGEAVGKTAAWASQVERGKINPSPKILPLLAEALQISEAELRAA